MDGTRTDANEAKPLSKWIIKDDAVDQMVDLSYQTLELEEAFGAAGRWMFETAREGGEMTDMEFVMESGKRIRGHKVWLMARCEYIRVMMSSGMKEARTGIVHVKECSDGAFMALLEYIYTAEIGKTCVGQDWGELWDVAHRFGMLQMGECLLAGVTKQNVEEAAVLAFERGMVDIMRRCVDNLHRTCAYMTFDDSDARSMIRTMDLLVQNQEIFEKRDGSKWFGMGMTERGIYVVQKAMFRLQNDAYMTERGCAILGTVLGRICGADADIYDSTQAFNDSSLVGIRNSLTDAILNHKTNDGVQEHAWRALENTGAEGLLTVMETSVRSSDEWMQQQCCKALQRLAKRNQPSMQQEGSGASSSTTCDLKELVCTVVEASRPKGISTVDDLKVLKTFGVKALATAMNAYSSDSWVQECCCNNLVMLLARHDPGNAEHDGALAWKEGGVDAVLNAMKAHRGSEVVQSKGCSALWWINYFREQALYTPTEVAAKKDQMYGAIIDAIEAHKYSIVVQDVALGALSEMSFNDTVARRLRIAEVALEAIKMHRTAQIKASGWLAVVTVCRDTVEDEVRRFVVGAGGVEAVVKALQEHTTDESIQAAGCDALARLCADRTSRDLAGYCGGVKAVVNVILGGVFDDGSEAFAAAMEALTSLCDGYGEQQGNRRLAWYEARVSARERGWADWYWTENVPWQFHHCVDGPDYASSEHVDEPQVTGFESGKSRNYRYSPYYDDSDYGSGYGSDY